MLLELLLKMKEYRNKRGIRYEFAYVIYFVIMAILSGANSYRKITTFIKIRFKELKEKYSLSWKKSPSYSAIREIIIKLPSNDIEEVFRKFANTLSNIPDDEIIHYASDGKVIRGSYDHFKDQKAIQFFSVFCSNNNLIMAHEEIECKTNEIPVAQKLIPELGITDAILTFDAMNCQTDTIDTVLKSNNDVIVQVKANQKKLLKDCIDRAKTDIPIDKYQEPFSKQRNRIESRSAEVFNADNLLDKWSGVNRIIRIVRNKKVFNTKKKNWRDKDDASYYISTKIMSAKEINTIIRNHWGIENRNHYVKDVTMREDYSRIRVKPQNMVRLRSFALNIMRFNGVKNIVEEQDINAFNFATY